MEVTIKNSFEPLGKVSDCRKKAIEDKSCAEIFKADRKVVFSLKDVGKGSLKAYTGK